MPGRALSSSKRLCSSKLLNAILCYQSVHVKSRIAKYKHSQSMIAAVSSIGLHKCIAPSNYGTRACTCAHCMLQNLGISGNVLKTTHDQQRAPVCHEMLHMLCFTSQLWQNVMWPQPAQVCCLSGNGLHYKHYHYGNGQFHAVACMA